MSWLSKLFGKKEFKIQDERIVGELTGKPVIDMRSDWERKMEREVQSDLGDEDERYARAHPRDRRPWLSYEEKKSRKSVST